VLESNILRLLAKDPQDRFASAQQVRHALEQINDASNRTAARGNLPQLLTDFVGRENEIAPVRQLLESSRLVTLLGEGIDKTQLALAIGAGLTDQFPDGVWRVELKSCAEPALVPQTVASVLGVHAEAHRALTVSLAEYLREKNLLLLLDQCDALIGACAQLAETILRTCPEVRILTTSVRPLNISDETCFSPQFSPH